VTTLILVLAAVALVVIVLLVLSLHIVTQYETGVLFRLGRVVGTKQPGLAVIVPIIDRLTKVALRIVTLPIQSQGIITKDNVSVDTAGHRPRRCPSRRSARPSRGPRPLLRGRSRRAWE
jgi:regulator of protease activity HflC (stomatin/prohibitin superfamily)